MQDGPLEAGEGGEAGVDVEGVGVAGEAVQRGLSKKKKPSGKPIPALFAPCLVAVGEELRHGVRGRVPGGGPGGEHRVGGAGATEVALAHQEDGLLNW